MSLLAVTKKDVRDARRSYALAGLTALFVCFAALLAAIQWVPTIYRGSTVSTATLALLNSMRQPTVMLVPLVGLVVGYDAIVGERESGSVKLLLGVPNTRCDVVLGKFLGRTAVVSAAVLLGYAVAALVAVLTYDSFALGVFVRYTVMTLWFVAVSVAIAVGFSAAMDSRSMALGGALGLYALFVLGWDAVLLGLQLAFVGSELPAGGLPDWIQFVGVLNPSTAFSYATRAVIPEYYELSVFPESDAVFLQDWVGFVVLALWLVVPLVLGYVRFERLDL